MIRLTVAYSFPCYVFGHEELSLHLAAYTYCRNSNSGRGKLVCFFAQAGECSTQRLGNCARRVARSIRPGARASSLRESNVASGRRYGWTDYNGYVEGWALYCERLGYELGLYTDPADQFGFLTFELWRAARLVVDTGIHWKGWSREEAIDYLERNSFLPKSTIESEVDRYIGMPGQALGYKVGERTISRLRQFAEGELKQSFSLRNFHDILLSTGPVTLDILESETRRWVAERRHVDVRAGSHSRSSYERCSPS